MDTKFGCQSGKYWSVCLGVLTEGERRARPGFARPAKYRCLQVPTLSTLWLGDRGDDFDGVIYDTIFVRGAARRRDRSRTAAIARQRPVFREATWQLFRE